MNKIFLSLVLVSSVLLSGCGTSSGFGDLDRFMAEADAKPRGKIEALPEVQVYRAFTYSAANRRSPFLPPEDVVVSVVEIQKDQSNVKPDFDRVPEVLESYSLGQLKMVGTLQRNEQDILWALIADELQSVHMAKVGQYMGKNHGRIVDVR
ncbi:pilus assembly protein PilP, partial [Oleiphilus sp. HI0117]